MADIDISITASSDDAQTAGLGETYNDTDEIYYIANITLPFIQGWRFQNVAVPAGATIDLAKLKFRSWALGVGLKKSICHGVDADNPATWAETTNEPIDAPQTTASSTLEASGADAPNGTSTAREFDITDIVAELVLRGGYASGNAMAFVTEDNGTSGRGSALKVWTFDNTVSIAVPNLEIDYTYAAVLHNLTLTGAGL